MQSLIDCAGKPEDTFGLIGQKFSGFLPSLQGAKRDPRNSDKLGTCDAQGFLKLFK